MAVAGITDEDAMRYGFRWGPLVVTRMAHIPERGYSLEVKTDHQGMFIFVSEKGRVIRPYPLFRPRERRTTG